LFSCFHAYQGTVLFSGVITKSVSFEESYFPLPDSVTDLLYATFWQFSWSTFSSFHSHLADVSFISAIDAKHFVQIWSRDQLLGVK
jgi:hypothetical protein